MRNESLLIKSYRYDSKQQGAATLVVAVVLLVIVLGISFFTAEVVITEKKITANEYRAKQAFHAAQAGLDYGIVYARRGLDQDKDGNLDLTTASGASVGEASYLMSFTDISSGADMSVIELKSDGFSDDGLIQRTASVLIGRVPLVPNPPDLPVVAKGEIALTGSLNIHNVFSNLNVWSGDTLDNWGSTDTYIRDPDWDDDGGWDGTQSLIDYLGNRPLSDVPTILSSTKTTRGPDVIEGDINLANVSKDDFTKNFFDKTLAQLVTSATYSGDKDYLLGLGDDVNGRLIHLSDGQLNGSFTLGTRDKPVIVVVDTPLRMTGGTINGLVIVSSVERFAGGAQISGGLVSESEIDGGAGTADVYFDGKVFEMIEDLYTMEQVRGSWRDWGH